MRLSYVLMVTAVTLLASYDTVSGATYSGENKLTAMVATDMTYATDATVNDVSNRLLRTARTTDLSNGDANDINELANPENSDDEERRFEFSASKLSRMLKYETFMYKKFAKWDEAGYAINDVRKYLNLQDINMVQLLNKYRAYLGI